MRTINKCNIIRYIFNLIDSDNLQRSLKILQSFFLIVFLIHEPFFLSMSDINLDLPLTNVKGFFLKNIRQPPSSKT